MCQIIFLESFDQHSTPVRTHTDRQTDRHTHTHTHRQTDTHGGVRAHLKFPLQYSAERGGAVKGWRRRAVEEGSGGRTPARIMVNAFCQVRLATPHISNYHSSPSKLAAGAAAAPSFTLGTGSYERRRRENLAPCEGMGGIPRRSSHACAYVCVCVCARARTWYFRSFE